MKLEWGREADIDATLAALDGRCSMVVAAEILYEATPSDFDELEKTLRALIGRGGCRRVVFCWSVRNGNEEHFLPRLADLGAVSVAWRSEGGDARRRRPTAAASRGWNATWGRA